MPKFLIPHKSQSHRVTAIALYRALISQCKKLQLPGNASPELHNLIGYRFRGFRHSTSLRTLKVVFDAGYDAVDHLDAAVAGVQTSVDYIMELLKRAPRKAKVSRFGARQSPRTIRTAEAGPVSAHETSSTGALPKGDGDRNLSTAESDHTPPVVLSAGQADQNTDDVDVKYGSSFEKSVQHVGLQPRIQTCMIKPELQRPSRSALSGSMIRKHLLDSSPAKAEGNIHSVLSRPVPQSMLGGTGTRKVPYLFSAHNIPVLRFKKPQPQSLSGYINSRLQQRQRRHDLKDELDRLHAIAHSEDIWDSIVYEHTGVVSNHSMINGTGESETSWTKETSQALRVVQTALTEEKEKNKRMAEKMLDIVKREAALAKKEAELAEKEAALNSLAKTEMDREVAWKRKQDSDDQRKLASFVQEIVNAKDVKAKNTAT